MRACVCVCVRVAFKAIAVRARTVRTAATSVITAVVTQDTTTVMSRQRVGELFLVHVCWRATL